MENMSKNKNLVSFNEMDKERHLELSRKGGQRSGEARRKKREEIERIRRTDEAMRAQQMENWQTIKDALKILNEAKRDLNRSLNTDLLSYIYYLKEEQEHEQKDI